MGCHFDRISADLIKLLEQNYNKMNAVLAICLPMSRDVFEKKNDSLYGLDFVNSLHQSTSLTGDALWSYYQPSILLVERAARVAELHGISVVNISTGQQLADLFEVNQIVTLLAHWRSVVLSPMHIKCCDKFRTILGNLFEKSHNIKSNSLRTYIISNRLAISNILSSIDNYTESRILICKFINNYIVGCDSENSKDPCTNISAQGDIEFSNYLRRKNIDNIFQNCFQSGGAIDLIDGPCDANTLAQMLPHDFKGVFDITMCNSVVLGEQVKRLCRCTCIYNDYSVDLDISIRIYENIVELVCIHGLDYASAAAELRREMGRQLRQRNLRRVQTEGI